MSNGICGDASGVGFRLAAIPEFRRPPLCPKFDRFLAGGYNFALIQRQMYARMGVRSAARSR